MALGECEYTSAEIASFVAWRYVRNNQTEFIPRHVRDEFKIAEGTCRRLFSMLGGIIAIERGKVYLTLESGYGFTYKTYILEGVPAMNGAPVKSPQGAFIMAYHLAKTRYTKEPISNEDLGQLVGWPASRARQIVYYKMRLLPLRPVPPDKRSAWVAMN